MKKTCTVSALMKEICAVSVLMKTNPCRSGLAKTDTAGSFCCPLYHSHNSFAPGLLLKAFCPNAGFGPACLSSMSPPVDGYRPITYFASALSALHSESARPFETYAAVMMLPIPLQVRAAHIAICHLLTQDFPASVRTGGDDAQIFS